ncbi:hypothetical protein AB0L41_10065 [Amycolatopsis mediterranei]|uniref:WXG100 family type VII secretion target n=1 Tax=Amycolatopsis mediterranei TaxID=33910 RepID=UPI003444B17D
MAEWAEIKKVLDDPNVSMAAKSKLMDEYGEDTFNFNAEEEEYAKKYIEDYSGWDPTNDWLPGSSADVDEALKEAQQESAAKNQEHQRQTAERDQAKKNLDGIATPTLGVGAKSSDEQLDQGNVAVDLLAKWTDEVWNQIKGGESEKKNSQTDLKDKFHENRGIQYQKFLSDADDLGKAHKVVEDTLGKSDTELQTLFGEWKGKGANAAEIKYDETIKPHAKELSQQIDGAAKLIPQTVTQVFTAVKKKVDEVLQLHRPVIAEADIPMAKDVLKIANGDTGEFDDFMKVAGWIDAVNAKNGNPSNLAERLQNDDCGFNDENKEYGRNVCRYWRDGAFATEYKSLITAFDGSCQAAKQTIDQQFGALARYMDGYRNQLTEAKNEGGGDKTGKTGNTGNTGNTGTGSTGTGGGGTGGGGTGGGATTPSAAEPPKAEEPPKPEDGKNPITGKPLEVDPSTGQPYPIDPKTGEAIKDLDDTDTVSVKKGDNTISMSEPDKEGKQDISVDDGHGHKKDYHLDWGDDDKAKDGAGKDGAAGDKASFGPQGSQQAVKDGQPSADGSYKPGPDGKIHIQDGNLKITAERPEGPDGPTIVTVDDGKGEPTTYTLDEKHDPKAGDLKADDLKADVKPVADGAGSDIRHDANAESAPAKDPAPANPDPAFTRSEAASGTGGFSAPGGFEGDLGGGGGVGAEPAVATADAGVGAGTGAVSADATTTAGASDFGSAVTGGGSPDFAGAVSLDPGAQTGSDASLPMSDGGGGLGATPVDPGVHQAAASSSSSSAMSGMGGMGMMGGMGGAPGGGSGGDQQRGASQYRIEGGVFETSGAKGRISGSLDDEGDRSIRYDR